MGILVSDNAIRYYVGIWGSESEYVDWAGPDLAMFVPFNDELVTTHYEYYTLTII